MDSLKEFLVKYGSWALFGAYFVIGCLLLFSTNPYQHHVFLTSAGKLASGVYGAGNKVKSYFALRDINEDLQRRNAELELEAMRLRSVIRNYKRGEESARLKNDTVLNRYDFILAHVINNTVNRTHNYATLESGSLEGIEPEMGVTDQNGVVGIVNLTTPHTSRIITLLNPNLRLSCKIKGREQIGSLSWDGRDPGEAVIEELPRHTVYKKGDTIVTSGYSTAFPEGIPVGVVKGRPAGAGGNFLTLRVKLLADFNTLSTVRVVRDFLKPEIRGLESQDETD